MTSLANLIRRNYQRPVLKLNIKRKKVDGTYDASWTRIDNYNAIDRVISWGSGGYEVNNDPGEIPNYEITSLTIKLKNDDNLFNLESDVNSFWHDEYTYIRNLSKIQIEAGYLDDDGSEVGTATVFEGILQKPTINTDGTANITALSYLSVLQKYDYSDLSLTGTGTISSVINAIMNQSKITEFIPYVASVPDQDVTVDKTLVSGTYWDVIKTLAYVSNSIPVLNNDTWEFKKRDIGVSSAWDFSGGGSSRGDEIYDIISYDDEGADLAAVYWVNSETGSSLTAISTSSTLLTRYLNNPYEIDLSMLTSESEKQDVLDANLNLWEIPKPTIEFSCRMMVDQVIPLDKITIDYPGRYNRSSTGDGFIWGAWNWGDGSLWGKLEGGINIFSGVNWMVTKVIHDFDSWKTIIKCERQVSIT
jgi:hypothetical protein